MVISERSFLHANARSLKNGVVNSLGAGDNMSSILLEIPHAVRCRDLAFSMQAMCTSRMAMGRIPQGVIVWESSTIVYQTE